jgi:alpha-N-acetylglucosaminidase
MLSVQEVMKDNDNYRYDLVDLARQALADYGKELLDEIKEIREQATREGEQATREGMQEIREGMQEIREKSTQKTSEKKSEQQLIDLFLQLILDQDRLLGTRSEFRLGRWTEAARAHALPSVSVLGGFAAESDLYERNARMLLTTWGDRPQCENGGLHDYANREWNGLLSSYYYPRWKAFFQNSNTAQHWFNDFEWPFATGATGIINSYLPKGAPYSYGSFRATPEGDEITMTQELFDKYFK